MPMDLPTKSALSVLAARFTVCAIAADVLDPKLALPAYTAVMLWLPTISDDIVNWPGPNHSAERFPSLRSHL